MVDCGNTTDRASWALSLLLVFPECWKIIDVVVIIKSDEKNPIVAKSYRPISLLPVPSMVLKRLIVKLLAAETEVSMSDD